MSWPIWMGDLPTWVTTAAIGVATASFYLDRNRRKSELAQEERSQAVRLSAWTVTDVAETPRAYGVIIDNGSGSTFHDLRLRSEAA